MNVILVAIHPYPSPQAVPLANSFLKGYLATDAELSAKVAVNLCDFFAGMDPEAAASLLLAENPDAVGLSMYLWNREECREIAAALRRGRPGLTLFAGGPEPTADPEGVLHEVPFDFLIVGEGEGPFLEAMRRMSRGRTVAEIDGIARREGETVITSFPRPVEPLDAIPSPYLAGYLPTDSYGGALWQLSRGCDFACSFCYDQKGARGVRRFPLERLKAELEWFVRNRTAQVFVLDSTFNQDMKRAKEVLGLIGRIAPHIHFHFEVRSEFLDAELARLFAQVNCSLQIGLQSIDPAVQKGVRRIFNAVDFSAKVALLNESGAVFGFDLIFGLPGDTLQGFERSLDFALELYPNHLDIFPLAVLPGTELAARADSLGLSRQMAPPYIVQSTPTFSAVDMQAAARLAAACDIFYSRGKAVAWFNSVITPLKQTPAAFLRGFGRWVEETEGRVVAESDLTDEDIWRMQRTYLSLQFSGRGLRRLHPAVLDLVDFHYNYAADLLAPQPEIPTDRELAQADLLAAPFVLAPGSRLVRFSYEIFDILEAGEIDLKEFTACFSPAGSCAVIYPRAGEVFTESLIEPYFRLLERLDGAMPAGDIAAVLEIPAPEAASFLEFAAAEGIIQWPAGQ
ncbi:MAG TPA: radical SAM protein [Geobacteraceae bacterium]|nr:radical SAM protein [Geobacteraceae bacterium]